MELVKWAVCVCGAIIAQVYCLLASMIIVHELGRLARDMWGFGAAHIGTIVVSGLCCFAFNLLVMDVVLWSWSALKKTTIGTDSVDKE
ncbi:MAG: hypothetical protein CMC15_17785 [Flavobacteriaceae bacterium]|nr:hypothetical protein [Flavobacteriaceae bacterium]